MHCKIATNQTNMNPNIKTALQLFSFLFFINTFSQDKKLWAKSVINQKAPELVVEKWLTDKPNTERKFVLIDFWSTWCGPCLRAIPELNKFKKDFEDDLIVIGISDEAQEKVEKLTKPKIEYFSAIDTEKKMYNSLEIRGIPHCILIDPDGIVRWEGFPSLTSYELTWEVIEDIITKYKGIDQNNKITNYSNYNLNELLTRKKDLELELNYVLVNNYIEQIEKGEIGYNALTKIDKGLPNPYWENVPELNKYHIIWKKGAFEFEDFLKKYSPERKELLVQYQKKLITQEEFYKKQREIMQKLKVEYPNEYSQLMAKIPDVQETMWIHTGRYMLEDYKKQHKIFPTKWLPEKYIQDSQKTKEIKTINKELLFINNEIIKKSI